jgi:hypothetical protein
MFTFSWLLDDDNWYGMSGSSIFFSPLLYSLPIGV